MKLPPIHFSTRRAAAGQRGFTMIEIALSLAVIGFALVAIIGVLPAGMNVQKENREQSTIALDAAFLMDVLRSGSVGQDDLTNHLVSLYTTSVLFDTNGVNVSSNSVTYTPANLDGAQILGLLSTPKYIATNIAPGQLGFFSNTVSAVFRAMNGPMVDMGANTNSKDFAFKYLLNVEVVPASGYAFGAPSGSGSENVVAPQYVQPWSGGDPGAWAVARNLQQNLYEIRLSFRWPVMANNQVGAGRRVFRSSVAGRLFNLPATAYWYLQPYSHQEATTP